MARRWSRKKMIAVGAAAGAVVLAGLGTAYVLGRRRPKTPSTVPGLDATVAPQEGAREPDGGYDARWSERRVEAIGLCQADAEVDTWPQAVACALGVAYPEAGPWTDPAVWQPWMQSAATLVEADMLTEVRPDGTSPTHWEMMLWLRAEREAQFCAETIPPGTVGRESRIAECVANAIYPGPDWSSPLPGWQQDFLQVLRQLVPTML